MVKAASAELTKLALHNIAAGVRAAKRVALPQVKPMKPMSLKPRQANSPAAARKGMETNYSNASVKPPGFNPGVLAGQHAVPPPPVL